MWPKTVELYAADEYVVKIRDKEIRTVLTSESLSGSKIRKVALPTYEDDGETLKFLMKENVPGSFPYTAGVFAFKREGEDPTRMFAGEGDAFRTNRRFKRSPRACPRTASPPPSTRSRCTAATRIRVRTSTARSATPACPSPPSTT
jgi:methylmalonyl-CoA mutase